MARHNWKWRVVPFLIFCALAPSVRAAHIPFTIADTTTKSPSNQVNFRNFTGELSGGVIAPAISHGNITFAGESILNRFGVYSYSAGSLAVVADYNTTRPGGTQKFFSFRRPTVSGGNFAFYSSTSSDDFVNGVYKLVNGVLTRVADSTMNVPGGAALFEGFSRAAMDGGQVAFSAGHFPAIDQLYRSTPGGLVALVTTSTPIPQGVGNFELASGNVASKDGLAVFHGSANTQRGIYANKNGVTRKVADRNTAAPSAGANFSEFFGTMATDGVSVAFLGRANGQVGIYVEKDGVIRRIAANGSALGPYGAVSDIDAPGSAVSIDGNVITFIARSATGGRAIYTDINGVIDRIAGVNDNYKGKTISALALSIQSVSDNQIAFGASFTDNSQAILQANIPEPTALPAILVLANLALGRRRVAFRAVHPAR